MPTIEEVLKNFDQRLKNLEARIEGTQVPRQSVPAPAPVPVVASPSPVFSSQPVPPAPESESSFQSASVLGLIGIAFVVLAGIFFIKLTIDSGWLTAMRQVLIAASVGLLFFIAPQFFPKAEREYGALLAGAGTTILHLTWLGAYSLHHIISPTVALVCATLVGLFSVGGNFGKGNRAYVLVAMAGTYLAAPIIGYKGLELQMLSVFLVIWNISFSVMGLIYRRRDIVVIASSYAVVTLLVIANIFMKFNAQELLVLQFVQFLIFSSALLGFSVFHKSPMSAEESFAILPVLLLFYFTTNLILNSAYPELTDWFGLIVGSTVLGIYFVAKKMIALELKSGPSLITFVVLALTHSLYFQLLDQTFKPLASLIMGAVAFYIWNQSENLRQRYPWPFLIFFGVFVYGAILTVAENSAPYIEFYNLIYGSVFLFGLFVLPRIAKLPKTQNQYASVLLTFAHFEIMLGLYRIAETVSGSGSVFLTITWGLYALFILGLSYWKKDLILGKSALSILLAVSLKSFFYDVKDQSGLIRIFCLLSEGLLLYFCGWV
ncbi:MAG: DUF2339 domain-containing protein, partial [Pseudobdellovibrionaceae bacterium]